jgi:predicted MFS family arabinose efflux permease
VAQICSWGSLYYSFPLIAAAMEADLGWSKSAIYGAATVGLLLAGLLAVPVGAAIDRGWGRVVMTSASILCGLLLMTWAFVTDLPLFFVAAAGIGALQAATLYDPVFAVIARRAGPLEARNGITALTLWGGFASTVFVPLVQLLLELYGWRGALMVLGGINICVCATLYFTVINPKADAPRPPRGDADGSVRAQLSMALRQPVFWGLALAFTAYTVTFNAFMFHFFPMMLERGFEAADAVMAMALFGPAQVAGRLGISLFARGMSVRRLGSIVVAVFPVGMAMLLWASPEFWIIGAGAIVFGAANGIMTIVRGTAVPEMVSRTGYGVINGALSVPTIGAKSLAPLAAALMWSATGSYAIVAAAILGGALVMSLAFWWTAAASVRRQVR